MRLKPGVRVRGVSPEALIAIMVAEGVHREHGEDMRITSITDGLHMSGSYHNTGEAVDIGLPVGVPHKAGEIRDEIAQRLGSDYDVILESDHIHIEHDP